MNDNIRKYKLRKIKRKIANRQDKKEFDPSKHPRAEEGDVNAKGEHNGGQFVKAEEQEGQESQSSQNTSKRNPTHENFPGAERYKRSNLGKKTISKSKKIDGFGGFYEDNNAENETQHFTPNLSMLCMVSPSVIKHIDSSFGSVESMSNRQVLQEMLSCSVISDVYTDAEKYNSSTNADKPATAYYAKGFVHLSKAVASGEELSVSYSSSVLVHEAAHAYDAFVCGGEDKEYSSIYKNGVLRKAINKSVMDFLLRYGYARQEMSGDELEELEQEIEVDLTKKGFTRIAYEALSDLIDAHTKGKINIGFGHTGYRPGYWDEDSIASEGYADLTDTLVDPASRKALEYAIPYAVEIYDKMNSDISEWRKNPLSKYVPIPNSLSGETINDEYEDMVRQLDRRLSRIANEPDEKYSAKGGKEREITLYMPNFTEGLQAGTTLSFMSINPETGERENMKLLAYKTRDRENRFVLFSEDGEPVVDESKFETTRVFMSQIIKCLSKAFMIKGKSDGATLRIGSL